MVDSHNPNFPAATADDAGAHEGPNVRAYLVIFAALSVFTLVSFLCNYAAAPEQKWITPATSFVLILGVAIVKAVLVAMFFMHLKWDWGRVYFMIVPVLILGTMMAIVLLPDIVLSKLGMWPAAEETPAAKPSK